MNRFDYINNDSNQTIIMMGDQTCSRTSNEYLPLKVLESYLSYGMSAALFKLFREKNGITYDLGVYYPVRSGNAPFLVYFSVSNKKALFAFELLSTLWKDLLLNPLIDAELFLAKEKLKGSFLLGNQSLDEILQRKIQLISYGIPSILIPYSYAADNHQYYNALILKKLECAEIIKDKDINTNELIKSISDNDAKISLNQISLQLQEMNPSAVAHTIESLPPKERRLIWSLLDTSAEGEILAELHDEIQQELMAEIKSDELVKIISDLEVDELVDILQNLPKVKVESVLSKIARRDSERIRTVLEYSEDSAGGLLNTDVISCLLYTSPSPRDLSTSRMPSSA